MAELKIETVKVQHVQAHPNADRLDIATVLGYQVIVGREQYKAGDTAVYIPVDSILPESLQDVIFADSKMKLSKDRVRAARIRSAMSFGLLVSCEKVNEYVKAEYGAVFFGTDKIPAAGVDCKEILNITKYEPPVSTNGQLHVGGVKAPKKYAHPDFAKYTSIDHGKRAVHIIQDSTQVLVATEKVHGTNFRCGWVPFVPRTFKQKVLQKLTDWTVWNFVPEQEFVYGSHNVQLQDGNPKPGQPANENVYKRAVDKFDLKARIPFNTIMYFEIYGDGIQKNYSYGLTKGNFGLMCIDIKQPDLDGSFNYLSWADTIQMAHAMAFDSAPVVLTFPAGCRGVFQTIDEWMNNRNGKARASRLDGATPMEGVVLRPLDTNEHTPVGRFCFKFISDEYLLNKSNTDNH